MPNNVPLISVPAPVIQYKNNLYLNDSMQYDPQTYSIPCGSNAEVDEIQHWFVPVTDGGIMTGCKIFPAVGDYTPGNPPTLDSLLTLRVKDSVAPEKVWWVVCTIDEYYASCQTCCGDAYVPIPDPDLPVILTCQSVCDYKNGDGNYVIVFAAQELAGGEVYVVNGRFNGEELPEITASDMEDLVNQLNGSYTPIGSPSVEIYWTFDGLTLTGTFLNGDGEGSNFCMNIDAIVPSP